MSLINKMNVGNTDYDIQDRLMPDAIGQVGQVLKVKDDRSGLEFATIESGGKKVSLTFPAGASEGTITAEQLVKLQASESNYIEMVNDKELYYLNDNGHTDGYLTYSHVGIENSKATIKTLTITVSAKSFVIVTTVVPTESGGGKYYKHYSILSYTSGATQLSIYAYTISNIPNNYTNFKDIVNNFISGFWKDPSTLYPITKLASTGSDIAVSYLNTSSGHELTATNAYIIYSDDVTEL